MNTLVVPKGTSVEAKLKFPCAVVTAKVMEPEVEATVTMIPFSCIGPEVAEGPGGAVREDSFHEVVPEMASVLEKRQPCKPRIGTVAPVVVPVAEMEPSHLVGVVSPT